MSLKQKTALFLTLGFTALELLIFVVIWTLQPIFNYKISSSFYLLFFSTLLIGNLFLYFITLFLLSKVFNPVNQIITKADDINIYKDIELIEMPESDRNDEIKNLVSSFNKMLQRIKEQADYQNAFFASASHELRTPLAVMLTRLQILLQNPDNSEETHTVYNELIKEVKQLIKMVNDFLLMSELNNNHIILSRKDCDLSELLISVLHTYKEKIAQRKLHFKISYSSVEETFSIFEDEDKVTIILRNIFDNIIKYSKEDSIITVSITKKNDQIVLNFSNEIREDINPEITDIKNKFYHSKPLHGEGYGLGLWIMKQLADLQDFEIFFTIKENKWFETHLII